nr:MAG TPA: hypothetical protein [Caudoviricetes sp.]
MFFKRIYSIIVLSRYIILYVLFFVSLRERGLFILLFL